MSTQKREHHLKHMTESPTQGFSVFGFPPKDKYMDNEFPPNSRTEKEASPSRATEKPSDRKAVSRVTTSKVIQRKKPLGKRFVETFTGDSNTGVMEYVLLEVLIPGLKDIVADVSTTTIERTLFGGEARSTHRRRGGGGGGYTSYNRMSNTRNHGRRNDREDRRPAPRRESRGPSDHTEIILGTRAECDDVLDSLIELISSYGTATMRDLLSLVGEPHNYTDEDWGWTDLRGSRVHRVREGYLIDLPRPEPLD